MHLEQIRITPIDSFFPFAVGPLTPGLNVLLRPTDFDIDGPLAELTQLFASRLGEQSTSGGSGDGAPQELSLTLRTNRGRVVVENRRWHSCRREVTVRDANGRTLSQSEQQALIPKGIADLAHAVLFVDFNQRPSWSTLWHAVQRATTAIEGPASETSVTPTAPKSSAKPVVDRQSTRETDSRDKVQELAKRYDALELEKKRCHRMLASVTERIGKLERRQQRLAQVRSTAPESSAVSPRQRLRNLEHQISELQRSGAGNSSVDALRREVYLLCKDLGRWQAAVQHRLCQHELAQQQRLHGELQSAINNLESRQRAVATRWQSEAGDATALAPWLQRWCQCGEHPVETEQTEAPEGREHVESANSAVSDSLCAAARDYLRRMSRGRYVGLHLRLPNGCMVIEESGERIHQSDFTPSLETMVYASVCLATIATLARRDVQPIVVWSNLFHDLDTHLVPGTLQLLRDFTAEGRSFLLITSLDHVAGASRRERIPVRTLVIPSLGETNWKPTASHHVATATSPPRETVLEQRHWAFEEFPGELTDRVRRSEPRASSLADTRPQGESSEIAPLASDDPLVVDRTEKDVAFDSFATGHVHTYCRPGDPVERALPNESEATAWLRAIGVTTIEDLLAADPEYISRHELQATWSSDAVRQWQARARLLCSVPALRPYDARILVACGIASAEKLSSLAPGQLRQRVRRLAVTAEGQSILLSGAEFELDRVVNWLNFSGTTSAPVAPDDPPAATDDDQTEFDEEMDAEEAHRSSASASAVVATKPNDNGGVSEQSPLVEAPSIGPKTAERLADVGVRTIGDLLRADAAELARRLKQPRLKAATIRGWQHAAHLVSQIPDLRPRDAQLLVAAGICSIHDLADTKADALWHTIQDLLATSPGKRIVRGGTGPSRDDVARWIAQARSSRGLNAA